jgi:hypothetical protein
MSTQNIFSKILEREIAQIRFRPTLLSFQKTPLVAHEFESDFEEWRASKHDDVSLYSPKNKEFLQITSDTINFVSEKEENELVEYIEKAFNSCVENTDINQIRRIGYRKIIIYNSAFEFQDLVDLFYNKFYPTKDQLPQISTDKPVDVTFVLDGLKNNFKNHVRIGPVKKDEAIKRFDSSFDLENEDDIKNGIIIDVDVFTSEQTSPGKAIEELKGCLEENKRIISEYLDYILS